MEAVLHHVKMNQFAEIGKPVSWNFTFDGIGGYVEKKQSFNAKKRCQGLECHYLGFQREKGTDGIKMESNDNL